ncbi:hypothetical protein [Bacillus sp. Cr_A10]|uniref:hypothetical protein n=1 Tax=Bacillus sp. Cr_A10 TaxID=3033993 RepID=UPI0023DADF42|nr:hypothetical protein [Bacillus sp. Cr_A10]MDF2065104.1 hypothetical protein [Bacillus sp. Cr_A10]
MLPLNQIFSKNFEEEKYWIGLEVHYYKINDQWKDVYKPKLEKALLSMTLPQLKELCGICNIDYVENKEEVVNKINSNEDISKLLYYLKEFQSKKKKAINELYEWLFLNSETRYDLSSINKLLHFYLVNKSLLFDVFTLYKWGTKASGNKYLTKKKLKPKDLIEIESNNQFLEKITDTMHLKSKSHHYKVVSTATNSAHKIIVLIYKQMADILLADFDGNKSNKKVSEIMFEIDLDDKSISIKSGNKTDEESLIEYFDSNFNTDLQKYKMETFTEFSKKKFEQLLTSPEISEGLDYKAFISSITFYSSSLWKSPALTFDLKDDDVWPAVVEANKSGVIRPTSLKDIRFIKLTYNDFSSKRIYSKMEPNGDITFRLQDANLTKQQIQQTNDIFEMLLGLPINQPISNKDFTEGTADKVDFILKRCNPEELGSTKELFDELMEKGLINQNSISGYSCANEDCQAFYDQLPQNDCEVCGDENFFEIQRTKYDLNFNKVKKFTKKQLNAWANDRGYNLLNPTTLTLYDKKYEMFNFEKEYHSIQVLVTSEILPGRTLKRFRKLLTPTIVIYVGYHEFDFINHNSDSIYPMNFGQIYSYEGDELYDRLDKIIDILDSRSLTIVTQASSMAYESLIKLSEAEDLGEYNDREFEDDVYAIVKDIFPNADKWGREMSGERVPEGLFSLQYNTQIGMTNQEFRRIYSFDCKLTAKEKGYDLGISEKRKAWDYIDELHNIRDITKYSDRNEVSGHIFITNKYKENQIDEMREFFNEKMSGKASTMPIFIEVDQIILIHKLFRLNYKDILIRRNTFYEEMNNLLIQEDGIIKETDICRCFEEVLEQEPEQRHLDMHRVRKNIKKGGKVGRT